MILNHKMTYVNLTAPMKTQGMKILPKLIESDHLPFYLSLKTKFTPDLKITNHCARTFHSYDHYDINKRIMKPIKLQKIDIAKLCKDLDKLAEELQNDMINGKEVNFVCNELTRNLSEACTKNYKKNDKSTRIDIPHIENCTSLNLKAISEANFECFQYYLRVNRDNERIQFYREK